VRRRASAVAAAGVVRAVVVIALVDPCR